MVAVRKTAKFRLHRRRRLTKLKIKLEVSETRYQTYFHEVGVELHGFISEYSCVLYGLFV